MIGSRRFGGGSRTLGTDFNLLEKIQRAKLAGYAIYENILRFSVDPIVDMTGNQKTPRFMWHVT